MLRRPASSSTGTSSPTAPAATGAQRSSTATPSSPKVSPRSTGNRYVENGSAWREFLKELPPGSFNFRFKLLSGPGVVDHEIRQAPLADRRLLDRVTPTHLYSAQDAAFPDPLKPQLKRRSHNDHRIEEVSVSGFVQQRDVLNHHLRALSPVSLDQPC